MLISYNDELGMKKILINVEEEATWMPNEQLLKLFRSKTCLYVILNEIAPYLHLQIKYNNFFSPA